MSLMNPHRLTLSRLVVAAGLVACLAIATAARADVVTMKDGRVFKGEILKKTDEGVRIDAMVATIRVTLNLAADEIASVQREPVPAGFYAPAPVQARATDAPVDGTRYLEVPIVGAFGQQVYADGIQAALRYAQRHRIDHIVFVVNSDGGDFDETAAISKVLRGQDEALTYHAVIRRCFGDALVVPIFCDTIHMEANASMGGTDQQWADTTNRFDVADELVARAQIAAEVSTYIQQKRGRDGVVVRAMIDPQEQMAAWRGEDGQIEVGSEAPPDQEPIFVTPSGQLLGLNATQLRALGVPELQGGVPGLGAALGIDDWESEGAYGSAAMTQAAERIAKRGDMQQAGFDRSVQRNVERREIAARSLESNIRRAAEWDPTNGDYTTYSQGYGWGWGGGSTRMSKASRQDWKLHTDRCSSALEAAARAANSMRRLDEEAIKLGLDPTFAPGELTETIQDLSAKHSYVIARRNRKSF